MRISCPANPRFLYRGFLALVGLLALLGSCSGLPQKQTFVTELNQPRGLTFDDAGNLYVAEAGAKDALDAPPAETNHSGRILRITPQGQLTPILDGLPFTHYPLTGDVGVTDLVWLDGALYALTGEGYDDDLSRQVLRVLPDGPPQVVGNILNFVLGSMPAQELAMGVGIASNPYAMAAAPDGSALFVSDGARGQILRVALDGTIRVFAELPHMPPVTGLAFGPDGRLYFAMFGALPHPPGSGEIWATDRKGRVERLATGLTMPIDLAFDKAGVLYVLEFGSGSQTNSLYLPGGGRLLRLNENGPPRPLLTELDYPIAMAFSPDGDLYITIRGAFSQAGSGAIIRVTCADLGPDKTCHH